MMTYVTAFIFYTLAMIGILLIGFVVYKKTFQPNNGESKGTIKILDSLHIGNKKHLLIVKIKNEKFLIASGLEHTTLLAKLDDSTVQKTIKEQIITPEVVDNGLVDEIYKESFASKKEARFDDLIPNKKPKVNNVQKQFDELFEQNEPTPIKINNEAHRKELIKQLLKDINSQA